MDNIDERRELFDGLDRFGFRGGEAAAVVTRDPQATCARVHRVEIVSNRRHDE